MMAQVHRSSFIAGEWVTDLDAEMSVVVDPTSEARIADVQLATREHADLAVQAARAAFPDWSRSDPAYRIAMLRAVATRMRERQDELTDIIVSEVGMPRDAAFHQQVGAAIGAFDDAADFLPAALEEERLGNAVTVMDPVGVVAGITPWNFPLFQIALKVAPALAAGCTFVLKPAELTPLSAIALTEILVEAGVPSGVFNLVIGTGREVGRRLAEHPLVSMVSLTGSTTAGKDVAATAAGTLKKVALELGGKGALLVLPDADLASAVRYGVVKCFNNNGQTCAALTRLLVPRERLAEADLIATEAVAQLVVGDPRDPGSNLGPLVSEAHRESVQRYVRSGIAEGARLLIGGPEAPEHLKSGWFTQPTVFSDVTENMTIAREEIFGPVLSITPYDDVTEAITAMNESEYGLAVGVYGGNRDDELDVARQLQAGCVFVGEAAANMQVAFGGVKQSGYGRERGLHGVLDYLVTKSLIGAERTE